MRFRDVVFKSHEKVTWWIDLPDMMKEEADGEGPFEILAIQTVPKEEWHSVGAKQIVTVKLGGKKKKLSALYFQHLN